MAIIIGLGDRGAHVYGNYILRNQNDIKIVAISDVNKQRMRNISLAHGIKPEMCFDDWNIIIEKKIKCDIVIITTPDRFHFIQAKAFLQNGYNVMLEKPMGVTIEESSSLVQIAAESGKQLIICHVLRYTLFFKKIKQIIENGRLGKIICIQHNENIGIEHFAHSYVRGNWRKRIDSGPAILTKCSHDMDILNWLADSKCVRLVSFGKLNYFNKESAPDDCPERCINNCKYSENCPFCTSKIYLTENTDWPVHVISDDLSIEGRTDALRKTPYGKCVFKSKNDVVDNQCTILEFKNGICVSFIMSAFTPENNRTIKILCTGGQISGNLEKGEIAVHEYSNSEISKILLPSTSGNHAGGDDKIMYDLIRILKSSSYNCKTNAFESFESHLMAFAAEESRISGEIIDMQKYRNRVFQK